MGKEKITTLINDTVQDIPAGRGMTAEVQAPTNEEMQNEYNYILAEQIMGKLLHKGLISEDEFDKIMAKNRRSFSPYLSKIFR